MRGRKGLRGLRLRERRGLVPGAIAERAHPIRATTLSIMAVLALAACSSGGTSSRSSSADNEWGVSASPRVTTGYSIPKGGGSYKVGQPYKVADRWYYPREDRAYDRTGIASWYGKAFHGRRT